MDRKKLLLGAQTFISVLFAIFLVVAGKDFKSVAITLLCMTLCNMVMIMFLPDAFTGIITFLITVGTSLQLSLGSVGYKTLAVYLLISSIIGLSVFLVRTVMDGRLEWNPIVLRWGLIALVGIIFLLAFLSKPVVNKEETESVYGFIRVFGHRIALFQLIIPLHLIFVKSCVTEDQENGTIIAFVIMHIMEFFGFLLAKEIGTLLILFLFSFVVLILINLDMFCRVLGYLFRNPVFYLMIILVAVVIFVNHFITLPVIGNRIHMIIQSCYDRIFGPTGSQLTIAKDAISLSGFANTDGGFVHLAKEAGNDLAFVSVSQRFGYVIGTLTLFGYFGLLIGSTIHLKQEETHEAEDVFMASFLLAVSSLITIAGTLQVIPLTGIPLYFLSSGGSVQIVQGFLVYYLIYSRRKEGYDV